MDASQSITKPSGARDAESPEAGQAAISLILILGLVLIGVFGFAIDFTNMWFHRQAATAAADAACQAGAMDMMGLAGGMKLPNAGFTAGAASDCVSNAGATMCSYAAANGYNGTGLTTGAASNSVSWTFPSSVTGVTPGAGTYPFMKVSIVENVKTYFVGLLNGSKYQKVGASSTCGLVQVKAAAPMVVLNTSSAGAFTYSGTAGVTIVGGPPRGLQINSSSATAVSWGSSGMIDLSKGGPNQTGSDVGITGGPTQAGDGTCSKNGGFCGGTTGSWKSNTLPIPDPYAGVAAPTKPANAPAEVWVDHGVDGCPDHRLVYRYYDQKLGNVYKSCAEYSPGYYPSGINLGGTTTAIFKPGIYYMNGSLNVSGSATIRMAKPAGSQATDGMMLYFLTGSLNISGGSGAPPPDPSDMDNVLSSDLTCDTSTPAAGLNMPATISGNVLIAQCSRDGTYWDNSGDTTDVRGTPGSRGILVYQAHTNTTQFQCSGSGILAYSGALYLHSSAYQTTLNLSGYASTGTYILGEIIADKVSLSGSAMVKLALNPQATTNQSKAAILQ